MKEDIQRIKRQSLDHIDNKLSKTNNTLLSLESILTRKFETTDKPIKISPKRVQKKINKKAETTLIKQIKELKQKLLELGLESQCTKIKKQVEIIMRQIIKYYTTQLSAKDNIIFKLEKSIEQYIQKIGRLQQEIGIKLRIENKFCETMPSNKPIPSNHQSKFSSLSNTKRSQITMDLTSQLQKHSKHEQDTIHIKSQILQKNILQNRKNGNLIDISQQFKLRQNALVKVSTNRDKRQDSVPSLPKPLRKNSVDQIANLHQNQQDVLRERVQANHQKLKMKTARKMSMNQIVQPPPPSNKTKPLGTQMFKGRKALLATSDTRGPDIFKLMNKNK